MNVAHLDIDIYNVNAKHIPKSSATTPQERNAFGVMMKECKMKDCFRYFNPTKSRMVYVLVSKSCEQAKEQRVKVGLLLSQR